MYDRELMNEQPRMKNLTRVKKLVAAMLVGAFVCAPFAGLTAESKAPDAKAAEAKKLKPYTLKTCAVSGEKLGGMGDPYVFEYKGREIKLCCKGCLKDFNKQPDKYLKNLEKAEAEAAKKAKK